jgi:hypothetical protein
MERGNFWYVWPSGTVKTDRHSTAIPQLRRRLLYEQGIGLHSIARCWGDFDCLDGLQLCVAPGSGRPHAYRTPRAGCQTR